MLTSTGYFVTWDFTQFNMIAVYTVNSKYYASADSVSRSVTKLWYHFNRRGKKTEYKKGVISAEFISQAEGTVVLKTAVECENETLRQYW